MALNINGTTGISGVDGSASAASVAGTDANTGLSFASDTVNINTGGSTRATVDSSGRLLVGTTDVGASGVDNLIVNVPSGNGGMSIRSGSSNNGNIFFSDGTSGAAEYAGYFQYQHAQDTLVFGTSGSESLRITSGGRVGIGETAPGRMFEVNNKNTTNVSCCLMHADGGDNVRVMGLRSDRASGGTNGNMIEFFNSSNSNVGNIQSNGSGTSYNTSSDYRLKENVTPISDGITRLKTLKPSRFNFIVTKDITVDGFLAHEVTAVPEAISGTKDQVATSDDVNDEVKEGDPIYQGIDQSKLVPLLTAALQEAIAKIEVLETKVAALEAG